MARKKRNRIDKTKIDVMKPITIELFGSKDDPCFGKLYSPTAKECTHCGDSEICAIVCAQKNKVIRGNQEKKHAFKDLEEVDILTRNAVKNLVVTNKITRFKEVVIGVKKRIKFTSIEEAKEATIKAVKVLKYKIIKKDGKRFIKA